MYKAAEEKINEGLSLFPRLIIALAAGSFGIGMILILQPSDRSWFVITFSVFCLLIALACLTRGRIRQFIGSTIGISLFILAIVYIYSQVIGGPIMSGQRSEPSILNSVLFMMAFGIPGLTYAFKAKFGMKKGKP